MRDVAVGVLIKTHFLAETFGVKPPTFAEGRMVIINSQVNKHVHNLIDDVLAGLFKLGFQLLPVNSLGGGWLRHLATDLVVWIFQ